MTIPNFVFWIIPGLPLASFGLLFILLRILRIRSFANGYLSIAATTISFCLSCWVLATLATGGEAFHIAGFEWLSLGNLNISIGITVDALSAIMMVVVTFISLLVQVYSIGYMHGSKSLNRYYGFISLFTLAMLTLVMANNLLIVFMGWEIVGLCSYQLIGFWYHRPAAAKAARKAFFITRLGDFGFLAAILLLFSTTGTLEIGQLNSMAAAGLISASVVMWAALGIFMGAMGKSAQFPLHTWLPDAMEGPTPVSALIHAATMVAAGVFLVARMFPFFEHSAPALNFVAAIGGFTAIFAATMALVMHDIKKVLAYSTISQLGYMMLGLALGGVAVGIFHLFTHAFFKALLFMGAGSVNHSTGTFDMRKMGGLARVMPWTCATFIIGAISLAGIWPMAGFFSKEEILASAFDNQPVLFALALVTVFMTAFYMFRVVFITFGGTFRSVFKPHESARVMVIPMVILAILAISAGWVNATGGFEHLFGHGEPKDWVQGIFEPLATPMAWGSLVLAVAGIILAYLMYEKHVISPARITAFFRFPYLLFSKKYWLDELYEKYIGKKFLSAGVFYVFQQFDSVVIDGTVNDIGGFSRNSGGFIRLLQNGRLQVYGLLFIIGAAALSLLVFA